MTDCDLIKTRKLFFSNHNKLFLENEKLQNDYDRLKKDERDKEVKLRELHIKFDRREQARQDLKVFSLFTSTIMGFPLKIQKN